jgi:nucleotide-binding universal stress UspA family protein
MKTVLAALDGSPRQAEVLASATDFAHRAGARVILFRAVGIPVELPHAALAASPSDVGQLLFNKATEELEGLAGSVPQAERGGVRVRLGTPWRAIVEAAQADQVDLIVIGAHGYSGLDRVLGTTAAKVVNHADRPVLVVRAPH